MRSENCFVYVFKNYVFIVGLIIDGHILTSKMHFLHRQQRLGHCTVHENFGLYVVCTTFKGMSRVEDEPVNFCECR